jgi:hypothetical protein
MEGIKESLIFYDQTKQFFIERHAKINSIKFVDDNSDLNDSLVYIDGTKYIYNVLGRFDNSTNFWEWGWSYEKIKNKIYTTRNFLRFGLENYDDDFELSRNIIINSKIKIEDKLNLDIILAISSRFLLNDGYIMVHKIKESNNIDKYIILKDLHKIK